MNKEKKKPILTDDEIKKRKARKTKSLVAVFVLVLSVGVMGNWYYQNSDFSQSVKPLISSNGVKTLGEAELVDSQTELTTVKESEYFTKARIERQNARDSQIDSLKEAIEKSTDDASKASTEEMLARVSTFIGIENKIETLVIAKGIENCIAVINENGTRVDVIVDCEELTDALIMQVKEIAIEQLECDFKDVSIIQSNK